MRLRLDLYNKQKGILTYNYKYPLRNALLDLISLSNPDLAEELHGDPKKPFAFSDIFGTKGTKNGIIFRTARVYVSSPDKEVIRAIGKAVTSQPTLQINDVPLHINYVYPSPPQIEPNEEAQLKTWSPIVIHDKEQERDLYIEDEGFLSLMKYSTRNRFKALTGEDYEGPLDFMDPEQMKTKRYKIKNTYHRGSLGKFRLKADEDMWKFVFDCGLGNKTKMGFGFIGGMKH